MTPRSASGRQFRSSGPSLAWPDADRQASPQDRPRTPPRARPKLGPTLAACLLTVCAFGGAVGWITDRFEAWTFEDLRRRAAAGNRLQSPPMALRDAHGALRTAFSPTGADGGIDGRVAAGSGGPAARAYLVDFIYTRCMTICQALGSEHQRMQSALREAGQHRVKLLSVSIDPAHDDQAALLAHGARYQADPRLWTLAAPIDEADGRAALRQLGVVAIPDGFGGYVHNGSLHLIDAGGRVHRIFDYAQWELALAAAVRLAGEPTP